MRKPALQKVREKIMATLPMLPDADLSHISSMCDGLLKIRAQVKREYLGKAHTRPSASIPQRLEQEENASENM